MILRDFKREDAQIIAGWLRSEEELYLWSADRYNKYPLTGNDINEKYAPQIETGRFYPLTAVDDNGNVTGHFIIRYPKDDDDTTVRFGFVIVDPVLRGKGYGKEMIRLGMAYVREHLSASRIDLGVFDHNEEARRCYEAAGFREYERRESILPTGTWICIGMEAFIDRPLETERLLLRRWKESDAEDLYQYASDPAVGPIAGWPAHQSIDESLDVIKNVLNGKEAYAVCLKEDGRAIGAIELKLNGHTDLTDRDDECEMGYWIGKPFWGQGIMPEAVKEMLRHAFEDCGMQKVWIGYYEGNTKSRRVQEKCGFRYQWRSENVDVPLMHEKRTGHVSLMTKEDWLFS
ncbi:MAG: GNAT family N-acetyltransferase [Lachnospiraceae bacterium]|nr:GNAT family N-acetyltransferase [Lachnospiraceae bacterium]